MKTGTRINTAISLAIKRQSSIAANKQQAMCRRNSHANQAILRKVPP
jgi:hypothetical protein